LIPLLLLGCASNRSSGGITRDLYYKKQYSLEDKSGRFILEREVGMSKGKKVFTKYQVRNPDGDRKVLERSVVLSSVGTYNKKYRLLRPYAHQYDVWFEKQKYSTTGKINVKDKSMSLKLTSPEEQWNKPEIHKFPGSQSIAYCYFSQVIECAKVSGFIGKAIGKNVGSMYLNILWEGYPYVQEQYLNIPSGFFTAATLEYDGENKAGEKRFTLKFGENAIFYFLDDNLQLTKVFWPSQGLSIVELGKKK
jgi:hypothetical protein